MFSKLFKKDKNKPKVFKKMNKPISDYDKNGFDEDWVHIVTGTRYDEYGFNKNRSIHKDTRLPTDTRGLRRNDYPSFNSRLDMCFDDQIENLFFRQEDSHILRKIITAPISINQKKVKYKIPIVLRDYKQIADKVYIGPTCLDGSPDMRYNGSFTTKHYTEFSIVSEEVNIKEVFQKNLSEVIIQEAIDRYNYYLFVMRDKQLEETYNTMIKINDECSKNKKLFNDSEEKISIYKKLEEHQEKFTEEQHSKFIKLGQEIMIIKDQIKSIDSFSEEFEELHKKLIIGLNKLKKEFKVNNGIDDLFNQLK